MSRPAKTLEKVLRGTADANIGFDDLCSMLRHLGFAERVRGGHHIFTRDGVPEVLNLRPKAAKAKPYQVRQVREAIVAHGLALTVFRGEDDDPGNDPPPTGATHD